VKIKLHKILLWITIISLIILTISTIPLLVSYLKDVPVKFTMFVDVHVWSGIVLLVVVLIRVFINRKKLKVMLTN
jgi:cytochrome b561